MQIKKKRKENVCTKFNNECQNLLTLPTESCRVVLRPSLLHAVLGLFKFVNSTAFMSQKIKIRNLKKKKKGKTFFFLINLKLLALNQQNNPMKWIEINTHWLLMQTGQVTFLYPLPHPSNDCQLSRLLY